MATQFTAQDLRNLSNALYAAKKLTMTGDDGVGTGVDAISPQMEDIGKLIRKAERLARKTLIINGMPIKQGDEITIDLR